MQSDRGVSCKKGTTLQSQIECVWVISWEHHFDWGIITSRPPAVAQEAENTCYWYFVPQLCLKMEIERSRRMKPNIVISWSWLLFMIDEYSTSLNCKCFPFHIHSLIQVFVIYNVYNEHSNIAVNWRIKLLLLFHFLKKGPSVESQFLLVTRGRLLQRCSTGLSVVCIKFNSKQFA